MSPFVELLNAALKQGLTYGVFLLIFCSVVLYADTQGHVHLATLGTGARTTVVMGLIAAAVIILLGGVNRSTSLLWPKAQALYKKRRERAQWRAAIAAADAEVLANYQVLPSREKLFLALVAFKGNQRFHIDKATAELTGLFRKGIVHLPEGNRNRGVFLVRDNVWALRSTLLEEMKELVEQQHAQALDPIPHTEATAWTGGLELSTSDGRIVPL
jgi:hypothetical protein